MAARKEELRCPGAYTIVYKPNCYPQQLQAENSFCHNSQRSEHHMFTAVAKKGQLTKCQLTQF